MPDGKRVVVSNEISNDIHVIDTAEQKCIRGFGFEELSMEACEMAKARMRKLPRKVAVIEEIKAFLGERIQKNEMVLAKFQRYLAESGARK